MLRGRAVPGFFSMLFPFLLASDRSKRNKSCIHISIFSEQVGCSSRHVQAPRFEYISTNLVQATLATPWLVVWKLKSRLVSVKHSEDVLQANPREHPVRWRSKVQYFASEATSRKCWALQDYTFLGGVACFVSFQQWCPPTQVSFQKKCCYLTLIAPVLGRKAF